ncbi:MAG: MetQ/NlpA family ABC transporter substrate-binding protein [Oscillospiraceae bacterium]|nr:MetQ/NlpA family ABC transporter substrate-binding protein [Oscillospiraceae bacterium]
MKKRVFISLAVVIVISLAFLTACADNGGDDGLIPFVVGATPVPHAEVLEFVSDRMAEKGFDMQIRVFTDFVLPNLATESGELDANYFQHVPYMDNFNYQHETNMVALFAVHFEPLGLYRSRTQTIEELQDGAIIAVPHDATNAARAFRLLEAAGLIRLDPDAGILATRLDIVYNPLNLDIRELEAAQLPHILPDVDMAVINGNFALQAGLSIEEDAVALEDRDSISAQTYANYIVVRAGNENDERVLALIEVMSSDEVRDFINERFEGRVVPVF